MLTRMFAYFTLFSYLVVGSVCVRFFAPEMTSIEISSRYFSLFGSSEIKAVESLEMTSPEMVFNQIQFPVEKKIVTKVTVKQPSVVMVPVEEESVSDKFYPVASSLLPFNEPVVLQAIQLNNELPQKLASLYVDFEHQSIVAVSDIEDEVSTSLAAIENPEAEPEFFEYEEKTKETKTTEETTERVAHTSIKSSTSPQIANNVNSVDNSTEEVLINDLVAFDYSKADLDLKRQVLPVISKTTTHKLPDYLTPQSRNSKSKNHDKPENNQGLPTQEEDQISGEDTYQTDKTLAVKTYPNKLTIQLVGTNLDKSQSEVGFEVRFQDDHADAVQDYNSGEITVEQELATPKMNRSVTVLKLGFAPTNTDLILEAGPTELSVPAIDQDTFNELLAPYESRGPIGAVLVELDEKVEGAALDVPYSQVIKLNEQLKVTQDNDFTYQLFVGVRVGNTLLSYRGHNGELTTKIIHVHERELTFEANLFEEVISEKVRLVEEDLLSKEKTPLIISSELVKQFATNKTATKLNDHTYRTSFNRTLLGSRKYLELGHQSEPIFVGFKEAEELDIPSENFMRYILSKVEGSKLGNRCLVQVNLKKKALKVDIGVESVGQSLMTFTQILDVDGKFYESISSKSSKIIVVGENQSEMELGQDGKINFKIIYEDGSVQFLGSYCSPNSYLVEQL